MSLLKFRPSLHRHIPVFQWLMGETGLLISLFAQKYPKMSLSGRSRYCRKLNCSNPKCYKRFVKYYGLIILVCLWIKQYRPACVNAALALSLSYWKRCCLKGFLECMEICRRTRMPVAPHFCPLSMTVSTLSHSLAQSYQHLHMFNFFLAQYSLRARINFTDMISESQVLGRALSAQNFPQLQRWVSL